ncbi:MAG TPA: ATP-binding protein, partial [Terriglobia bacterium]|nr:ATP-binding protein [Terriglobia bacterium]
LPRSRVLALYEDGDGVLWIGTSEGGLVRFKDGKFTRYTVHDGLFNNGVFQILEDGRGNLWMSCDHGIYRASKRELNEFAAGKRTAITSIAYGKSDGMRNIECNGGQWPAGIKAQDGKLWFPTQDGVAVLDPEAVSINSKPPPVVIESCLVDDVPVRVDGPVRIKPGEDNFEIHYTALSFINPKQIKFRYEMEGLDRHWVTAGARRTAYYSHVPPGDYTFRVIAANSDGVWNMKGQALGFVIIPPFYRTWWFILLMFLVAATAVSLAWQYRAAQLKRAHATQQAFSRQLIDSQEQERKRIAAELHDSLGQHLLIIKNWATMAMASLTIRDAAKEPLDEISSTATQAIEEVREIAYNLRPYQLERLGLTTALQDLANQVAASSSIRLSAQVDSVDAVFPKDAELSIYRIVQEALNNTIRHSEATQAWIAVSRRAGMVEITIRDNGRGFTPPAGDHLGPKRNGFGLVGIAERVRILGGQTNIQSSPGHGCTIRVSLATRETSP